MAFAHHALHEADILLGFFADEHEGGLGALIAENIENLWGPFGVRAVVEGKRDFVWVIAVLLDGVGVGINFHVLIDDESCAQVGFVSVLLNDALAGLWLAGDADDVAVALVVD